MFLLTSKYPVKNDLAQSFQRPVVDAVAFKGKDLRSSSELPPLLKDLEVKLKSLGVENAPSMIRGEAWLWDTAQKPVSVQILETNPTDVVQVMDWYELKSSGEPSYGENQKWREWWYSMITSPPPGYRILKLMSANQQILGVMALVKRFFYSPNQQWLTWLKGVRIAPRCNSMMTSTPDYKGVGSALVTQAVIESFKEGTDGVGLNSTLGTEPFYEKLNLKSQPATDGYRTCFTLTGSSERLTFLKTRGLRYRTGQSSSKKL